MTNLQYKEMVLRALESLDNTSDSVDAVRKILSSCGVEFPYGLCESILDSLSNNKLAQWRSCTLENAAKSANNGIVTIGINNDKVVVIIPDSDDVDKSEFVCTANSLIPDKRKSFKFFANSTVYAVNGWTSDVPTNQTTDGFGGWYHRGCYSEGVAERVPRFVQFSPGPCLAYSIMSGDYYLHHSSENVNTFFTNRYTNGYINASGGAQWGTFADVMDFDMSYMKGTLESGEPVIVSGNNGNYDHFVLVVAYTGKGTSKSDYTVIDPWHSASFPTTFEDFSSRFPNDTAQFSGFQYPMFIFK